MHQLYARGVSRTFPPLAPLPTTSSAVAERIREAILGGMLQPGERLKEEQLARELGTSRTPVREALLVLQAEGLVEASPNRGAAVRLYRRAELEEMYDLRALLEGHAAGRAAERIGDADLQALRESRDRFARLLDASDLRALVEENAVFHETILRAADSDRLGSMVSDVVALPLVYRSYVWYSPTQTRASYEFHCRLVEALERGDAVTAEHVMREHVLAARDVLVEHLGDGEEESP
jgi:DNA-binding GntR family transcriptional regulator